MDDMDLIRLTAENLLLESAIKAIRETTESKERTLPVMVGRIDALLDIVQTKLTLIRKARVNE
jgi:hypothetical protein